MIPSAELAALQAVAEAATQVKLYGDEIDPSDAEANAAYEAFWAAFSPATALRLLKEHREMAERVRVLEEWQPIETAPKDGSWFLAWAQRDSSPYRVSWGRNHNGQLTWCTMFGSFFEGYLTHWKPLDPPAALQGAAP